jgi:hypothetical protein
MCTLYYITCYLRHVCVEQVRVAGPYVGHRADQSLPETKQVVDTVGRELPRLKRESEDSNVHVCVYVVHML